MGDYDLRKEIFEFIYDEGSMDERRVTNAVFDLSESQVQELQTLIGKVSPDELYHEVMENDRIVNVILDYCTEDKYNREDMFYWMQELPGECIQELYDQIESGVDPAEIW